jgi:multidrug transporter EmrE-like cation transporter
MMFIVWLVNRQFFTNRQSIVPRQSSNRQSIKKMLPIILISIFLIVSDNVYMLALRDPDSMIAVVSTIRRGGAVIGFAYGLLFLRETDPWRKIACMLGILAGLICLALGSI